MAGTNRFAVGNIVGYDRMIGIIKKNCNDFKYWEVEFGDCTRTLHYKDMIYIGKSQSEYDLGLEM